MREERPTTLEGYKEWVSRKFGLDVSAVQPRYEEVVEAIYSKFSASPVWSELTRRLDEFNQAYQLKTNYSLLMDSRSPTLLKKSYQSFLEKTLRKNCLENRDWSEEPKGGWYLPDRCHAHINDLVRTTFVVKYLDGIDFLWRAIEEIAIRYGVETWIYYEARAEGYYGAHVYLRPILEIPGAESGTTTDCFHIELQITTQMKEVIRKLAHRYYETRRIAAEKPAEKWQWNPNCEEFVPNYLGHILHYVEGMIMQLRDKESKEL